MKDFNRTMWWSEPDHLTVRGGQLLIGGVPATSLASQFGTPVYVYNAERIAKSYHQLKEGLSSSRRPIKILYALKANSNRHILRFLAGQGAGVDAASISEATEALEAGVGRDSLLFSGVNVSSQEMQSLVQQGVTINIDSLSQLRRLAASGNGSLHGYPISLRYNPGIGTGLTPGWIAAGVQSLRKPIKFGLDRDGMLQACREALGAGLNVVGIHQHIGSGWLSTREVKRFHQSVKRTLAMALELQKTFKLSFRFVDLGGGLGYRCNESEPDFPLDIYCKGLIDILDASPVEFQEAIVEPGSFLVGTAGVLLTTVNTVENKGGIEFLGVDSGLNTFNCPALYHHLHEIVNASRADSPADTRYTVSGNLCEAGDLFAIDYPMPRAQEGDVLAILGAGAYGAVLASPFNGRPKPPEVMLLEGEPVLISNGAGEQAILNKA